MALLVLLKTSPRPESPKPTITGSSVPGIDKDMLLKVCLAWQLEFSKKELRLSEPVEPQTLNLLFRDDLVEVFCSGEYNCGSGVVLIVALLIRATSSSPSMPGRFPEKDFDRCLCSVEVITAAAAAQEVKGR